MTILSAHSRLAHTALVVLLACASAFAGWKEKVLYSFQGYPDGEILAGGVVFDKAGNLYGATTDGGSPCPNPGCGTVFELSPGASGKWTETVLFQFNGTTEGSQPGGSVIIDTAGNLYGTASYGGTGKCTLLGSVAGCGVVYELSPPKQKNGKWKYAVLYNLQGGNDGYLPQGDLTFDGAGNLYGATLFGGGKGTNCNALYGGQCGTVFKLSPPKQQGGKWTEKVLHSFAGIASGKQNGDGGEPNGGLTLDSEGAIYGTTYAGGYNCPHSSNLGCGTMFKLAAPLKGHNPWSETFLHISRGIPDGTSPAAGMVFHDKGNLYGTTLGGGPGNSPFGTIFQLTARTDGSWAESLLHGFQDGNDGSSPRASLIVGPGDELYDTASGGGGQNFAGTLFRLKKQPAGSWTFTVLYAFSGVENGDGAYPAASVVLDAAGNIFGTTQVGGTGGTCRGECGTVFEVSP